MRETEKGKEMFVCSKCGFKTELEKISFETSMYGDFINDICPKCSQINN